MPAALAGSAAADVNADQLANVPKAQPKVLGRPVPNKLSRELAEIPQASGADLIDGADPAVAPAFYGYDFTDAAHPLIALPPATAEAQKTEPDKNTYLVLSGQKGADPDVRLRHALRLPGPRGRAARGTSRGSTSTPTATTASR